MKPGSHLSGFFPGKSIDGAFLVGLWKKTGILTWGVINLFSPLSFTLSIYRLNKWDGYRQQNKAVISRIQPRRMFITTLIISTAFLTGMIYALVHEPVRYALQI